MLTDEYRYRILKLLQNNPTASQREIARELGVSLGRVNFCLQALVEKGLIKVDNFRQNESKRAYLYYLTPKGFSEKSRLTAEYLTISFNFFRDARAQCAALLDAAVRQGWRRIAIRRMPPPMPWRGS